MLLQLATERRQILDCYNESKYDRLIEIEAAIVATPHVADSDRAIKSAILFEDGKLDLADLFKERLIISLQ